MNSFTHIKRNALKHSKKFHDEKTPLVLRGSTKGVENDISSWGLRPTQGKSLVDRYSLNSKLLSLPMLAMIELSIDGGVGGVLLDELAAGINVLTHEH